MNHRSHALFLLLLLSLGACAEALYPPRPAVLPGPPIADPPSSRVVVHVALTEQGLVQLLNGSVPQVGAGDFSFLGQRKYSWRRGPFSVRFDGARGTIGVHCEVQGGVEVGASLKFTLALDAEAQPVLSSDYRAQLQALRVTVSSDDTKLKLAQWGGGVLETIRAELEKQLRELRLDLRPLLDRAYANLAQPVRFPVGDAQACADLGLQALEAGPTVLAGGVEKDLAIVVAPSVTLPCSPLDVPGGPARPPALPPLHNVASVPSGPFSITVPIAATYAELQKAMAQAFTGGKLYFSKEYPELYMEKPEVYASGGEIVVKLHLDGHVKKGFKIRLSGDLYLNGHPQVRDNELEVPDLQPTVETASALLKLKTSLDTESIRREARQALRLDLSARLLPLRQRLSDGLSMTQPTGAGPPACLRGSVGRIEVTGIYVHDAYLRLYVTLTASASAYLPCPATGTPIQQH